MTILKGLRKIQTIVNSRKEVPVEPWVLERRKICHGCEYNSKNFFKVPLKQKIYRFLSNLLTLVMTGKKNKSDDECTVCYCTLYYKTKTEVENCEHPLGDKWKSISIPNKK